MVETGRKAGLIWRKSLPWLILADEGYIVTAEGFGVGEVGEN